MIPRPRTRLLFAIAVLLAIVVTGTFWYVWIEDFGLFGGLYMAVITLTTVGYEEVGPLDTSGRWFTIGYVLAGIGVMFYVASSIVEELVAGGVAEALGTRRWSRKAKRMRDHVVICGQGRVGREVLRLLRARDEQVLAIDAREDRLEAARSLGAVPLLGDATDEEVLLRAHIERARVLVAAAGSDAVNTFIVLTARALHPDLLIIARAASEGAERRLEAAGANRVISPHQIAGRRMAVAAVQPLVLDFIDTLAITEQQSGLTRLLAELEISGEAREIDGRTVAEVFGESDVRLIAIVHADGELTMAPAGPTVLRSGDRLMLYGGRGLDRGARRQERCTAPGLQRRPIARHPASASSRSPRCPRRRATLPAPSRARSCSRSGPRPRSTSGDCILDAEWGSL